VNQFWRSCDSLILKFHFEETQLADFLFGEYKHYDEKLFLRQEHNYLEDLNYPELEKK